MNRFPSLIPRWSRYSDRSFMAGTTPPPETAPVAGRLKFAPPILLADQCGLGGSVWFQQFIFGFPLVGRLSQKYCYPAKLKGSLEKAEPLHKIPNACASRFADRANKSGHKNAQVLWGEALSQCEKRWLNRPFPLCSSGKPCALQNKELNIAFRFGVEQSDKPRASDDLRRARANLACVVETPIKLVSWDHLAERPNLVNAQDRVWAFSKSDHEAA